MAIIAIAFVLITAVVTVVVTLLLLLLLWCLLKFVPVVACMCAYVCV